MVFICAIQLFASAADALQKDPFFLRIVLNFEQAPSQQWQLPSAYPTAGNALKTYIAVQINGNKNFSGCIDKQPHQQGYPWGQAAGPEQ